MRDQILILNFDNAYSANIASKLRAEKISARILPGSTPAEQIMNQEALGVILSGGIQGDVPEGFDGTLLRYGIPVLALGSAAPAVCALLGGQVGEPLEINDVDTLVFLPSRITEGLSESERMFGVIRALGLTDDMEALATHRGEPVGIAHKTLSIFGVGCQLEPNDPDLMNLLMQFATNVCGCTRWWGEDAFISQAKSDIEKAAGEGRALCVMSGGLNSGVAALLSHKALGDRLDCVFVDTGLLRENEVIEFAAYYKSAGLNLRIINAADRVLDCLKGLTGQDQKRGALEACLQDVLGEAAGAEDYSLLIDPVSSDHLYAGDKAKPSKAPLEGRFNTYAPLGGLFKEEIRRVGEALGLPHEMSAMQPFPWTGLALRVMGEVSRERLNLLRRADAAFVNELKEAGLTKRLWKYFAVLYEPNLKEGEPSLVIGLRAVSISHTGSDLRAIPARLPWDLLERYTQRMLTNEAEVTKVTYDLTPGKGLQEIEWY